MAKKKQNSKSRKNNPKNRWLGIVSIIIIVAFVFVYVLSNMPMWGETPVGNSSPAPAPKSQFDLEGTLTFLDAQNNAITNIYIEIADDAYSREKGMMHRLYIPDTVGMLFIFPEEDHRAFWMKNTPSSLDILYATADFEIIKIHENTPPYSHETIPSGDKAKYVIEVKSGFVSTHQIKSGHRFTFRTLD
jgi:hypothetical protein